MSEFLTKHAPTDDYPFLCYASEMDANVDNVSGGGGGVFIVNVDEDDTLDKTFGEIKREFSAGKIIYVYMSGAYSTVLNLVPEFYSLTFVVELVMRVASADSDDDYPTVRPLGD